MTQASSPETLTRIEDALKAAMSAISQFIPGTVKAEQKSGGRGPITEADRTANRVLYESLVRPGEGWLSEETVDDLARLERQRVWVVDPLDGTSEFVAGIPEWCVSVALVENGRPVAGGICNPATEEIFLGARGAGITYNGQPAAASTKVGLAGTVVLASRSELKRGEWERFRNGQIEIRPTGSVAYKLALVAAGRADATWTLTPKNEWDVAAGVALIEAGGGVVRTSTNLPLAFNQRSPVIPGLFACGRHLANDIAEFLREHAQRYSGSQRRSR
ncbi:MAG TPA: 3'(2'),5'-bisphosphate nucleotidase CysQ [Terriglobia bacterium]|nr:3'(2'),5'-bisphosphate nucleotidase CysQ [Terriglobia bacterium]